MNYSKFSRDLPNGFLPKLRNYQIYNCYRLLYFLGKTNNIGTLLLVHVDNITMVIENFVTLLVQYENVSLINR